MNRRSFLRGLMALGAGIAVVGPSVLADVHRYIPVYTPPTHAEIMAELTKLTHDIFCGSIARNVRRTSPIAAPFDTLPSDFVGKGMVFSTDLSFRRVA